MNFEKLYSKLPEFIKYNNYVLDFSLKIPKLLFEVNKKSAIINSQNQLFELIFLHSDFQLTGASRDVQLLFIELLRFVDNVCNKYDIDYWIDYGTLLGAVRHGGFIPWDDDIDISIMRKDYEKLIEVLPEEISKYDYFKQECGISLLRENHENYFKGFNSVYDFEDPEGFFDEEKFLFLQLAWLKPYVKIDFFPKDYILEEKVDFFKKNYVSTKYKFNTQIKFGKKKFDEELEIQNKKLGLTDEKTCYVHDSLDCLQLSPIWIYETNKIFPLGTINFEGYNFKCPKDVDYCLSIGISPKYMQLPSVIKTHKIINFIKTQFKSEKEMRDKFKKSIDYLKDINDNFE